MRPNTSTRTEARPPAVAGLFYSATTDQLKSEIESCYLDGPGSLPLSVSGSGDGGGILGVVCPHAGYAYSGAVACHSYHAISGKDYPYVVMVGPDHRSAGPPLAASGHDSWETPLMTSPVHRSEIPARCGAVPDAYAHRDEHSLEVQLPIIQYTLGPVPVLPILMADQSQERAVRLGRSLAHHAGGDRPAVVASSDLTHYEPDATARSKDMEIIAAILDMDVGLFYRILYDRRVSACGYGAIAAIMEYCRETGASGGHLLKYATSGDAGGDYSSVVGYCSVSFS